MFSWRRRGTVVSVLDCRSGHFEFKSVAEPYSGTLTSSWPFNKKEGKGNTTTPSIEVAVCTSDPSKEILESYSDCGPNTDLRCENEQKFTEYNPWATRKK